MSPIVTVAAVVNPSMVVSGQSVNGGQWSLWSAVVSFQWSVDGHSAERGHFYENFVAALARVYDNVIHVLSVCHFLGVRSCQSVSSRVSLGQPMSVSAIFVSVRVSQTRFSSNDLSPFPIDPFDLHGRTFSW